MLNQLNVGNAFLLATPPNDKYLFIIIAPTENGKFFCVNLTSKRNNSDTSCILQKEDHTFIKHDSVINYKDAREINPLIIKQLILKGDCKLYKPVSQEALNKIQDRGITSTRLKNKYKNFLSLFIDKR
ncbi:MAG: hypothetical protein JRJ44_04675 [Deltaproteobacteria bacterium]|nr:hypothetical protein [Deltaproteobacteria bacterium]